MRDADRLAGIVDQHVEPAVPVEHRRDQRAGARLVGEIGLMVAGARQLGGHLPAGVGRARGMQRDRVAVARQTTRDRRTDARGRAGDEGDATQTSAFNASRVSSGRSTIMKWPQFGMTTVFDRRSPPPAAWPWRRAS